MSHFQLEFETPRAVVAIIRSLQSGGHSAWWVGESLHAARAGRFPIAFEVATSRSPNECLQRHANAVPTRLEDATVMIPSAAGPVDVSSFRGDRSIEDDLALRPFSVHAMASDPISGRVLDPFDGAGDASARRLRSPGPASARLREDPLRALRAARMCAEYGYEPDPELLAAMRDAAKSLRQVRKIRLRWELSQLLRGPGAEVGAAWLHRAGLADALFPGSQEGNSHGLDGTPPELAARLAWLLRGTRSAGALRRLGFGRVCASRVQHLLAHHPIDESVRPSSDHAVGRLLRRLNAEDLQVLLQLRSCELDASAPDSSEPARGRLAALRATMDRVHRAEAEAALRPELALDGRSVIEILGCEPGPIVGRALGFLAACVTDDPACNTHDALRAKLQGWEGVST